jgi:tetratricopeptide (TPR) repeat protein
MAAHTVRIGTLNQYSSERERQAVAVTTAVPWGLRDPHLPLRGRDPLLAALGGLWSDPSDGRIHVLCGMGGCGKTALAMEVAHRARQDGARVWWVDARQPSALEVALRAVARQAGADEGELDGGDAPDVLWQYLGRLDGQWLLVVDNADVPEWLDGPGRLAVGTGWIRPHHCPGGRVLVTSRDAAPTTWGPAAALHPVGPLPANQAARVLMDHTRGRAGTFEQAAELARSLGGLPLALRLAGTYLADTTATPPAFRTPGAPDRFPAYGSALREGLEQVDPDQVLARTWQMSLDLLATRGMPQAAPLLDLLCGFADAPLPYTLLHPPTLAHNEAFAGLDGPGLWKLLQGLNNLGLIDLADDQAGTAEPGDGPPTLRIHPLVRTAHQGHADQAIISALLERAARADEARHPEDIQKWPQWQALAPHTAHLVHGGIPADDQSSLVTAAFAVVLTARYLQARGLYGQARALLEAVLAAERTVLGDTHPNTLDTRHNLALILLAQDRYDQARQILEEILSAERTTIGENHPHALTTRHNLARTLYSQRHYGQARVQFEAVLKARRSALGDAHPSVLATRHELARTLHGLRRFGEAHALFEEILNTRCATLDEDHPDVLDTRYELARVLQSQGHYSDARRLLEEVLEGRREALGKEHPMTLETQRLLGELG